MRRLTLASCLVLLAVPAAKAEETAQLQPSTCRIANLALAFGPEVSPATGMHPLSLRVVNRSGKACLLFGYPSIEFRDGAGAIPFRIRRSGDQMVTSRPPARVLVRPRQAAFAALNKYRCDIGNVRTARVLRLRLPGTATSARRSLALPEGWIGYCGKGDPGSIVSVSPFTATLRAALSR